jgi:hypothetical protein
LDELLYDGAIKYEGLLINMTVEEAKKFEGKKVLLRQTFVDSLILPYNMICTILSVEDNGNVTFGIGIERVMNCENITSMELY